MVLAPNTSRLALVLEAGAKHAAALQEASTGVKLKSKEKLDRPKPKGLGEGGRKKIEKVIRPPPPAGAPQLQRQNARVYSRAEPLSPTRPRVNWGLEKYGNVIKALRAEIETKTYEARALKSAWLEKKDQYGEEAADVHYYLQRDAYARLRSLQAQLDLLSREQDELIQERLESLGI